MADTTYACDSCTLMGRIDGMMHYEIVGATETLTYLWHPECPEPSEVTEHRAKLASEAKALEARSVQVTPISNLPSKPSPNQMALANELERDRAVVDTQAELRAAQARIKALEADLRTIEAGKEAAERALRAEQAACVALARHGTLQLDRNWIELANEMAMLKGTPGLQEVNGAIVRMTNVLVNANEPFFQTQAELDAYRESLVIDFMNLFRRGAFSEIDKDVDEIVVVKAQAYNIAYKVCCEVLSQRNIKLKIARNASHQLEIDSARETRIETERKKIEKSSAPKSEPIKKRNATAEEIIFAQMLKLSRGDERAAKEMYDALMAKKVKA